MAGRPRRTARPRAARVSPPSRDRPNSQPRIARVNTSMSTARYTNSERTRGALQPGRGAVEQPTQPAHRVLAAEVGHDLPPLLVAPPGHVEAFFRAANSRACCPTRRSSSATRAASAERCSSARKTTGRRSRKVARSEEHTSELQSHLNLVCRLLLEKKKKIK